MRTTLLSARCTLPQRALQTSPIRLFHLWLKDIRQATLVRFIYTGIQCHIQVDTTPLSIMPAFDFMTKTHELSQNASPFQFAMLPSMLAYAAGLTSDFSTNIPSRCTHARPKPSLKMRILCLASVFGFWGTIISPSSSVDTYLHTELPIAKAGLLANIGPDGAKSSGAKVCVHKAPYTARTHLPSGRDCDSQSEYRQPELSVHLGSRLVACVQGYCRPIH